MGQRSYRRTRYSRPSRLAQQIFEAHAGNEKPGPAVSGKPGKRNVPMTNYLPQRSQDRKHAIVRIRQIASLGFARRGRWRHPFIATVFKVVRRELGAAR
jgi:hypothetical protein